MNPFLLLLLLLLHYISTLSSSRCLIPGSPLALKKKKKKPLSKKASSHLFCRVQPASSSTSKSKHSVLPFHPGLFIQNILLWTALLPQTDFPVQPAAALSQPLPKRKEKRKFIPTTYSTMSSSPVTSVAKVRSLLPCSIAIIIICYNFTNNSPKGRKGSAAGGGKAWTEEEVAYFPWFARPKGAPN